MESNLESPQPHRPAGCHRLPQIPTMGRNVRTAQSKSSARISLESKLAAVKNDSQVVNIWTKDDFDDTVSPCVTQNSVDNHDPEIESNDTTTCEMESEVVNEITELNEPLKEPVEGFVNVDQLKETQKDESLKVVQAQADNNNVVVKSKRGRKPKNKSAPTSSNAKLSKDLVERKSKRTSQDRPVSNTPSYKNKKIQSMLEMNKSTSKSEPGDHHSDGLKMEIETQTDEYEFRDEDDAMEVVPGQHVPRCVIITSKEVPNEVQHEKMMEMQSVSFDLEHPPQWSEGDMLWGKVSGHPYWPCMVSPCPFTKMLSRVRGIGGKCLRGYHLQFFGNDCERGWLLEPSTMEYKGKEDFLELVRLDSLKPKTLKKGKSAYNPFKVKPTRLPEWNLAVEEAENAFKLNVKDRILQYTFDYVFLDSVIEKKKSAPSTPTAAGKRKRKESSAASLSEPKRKIRKIGRNALIFPSCDEKDAESTFDVYYAKHRSSVMGVHPDWDTTAVFEYLKQQWASLSPPASNSSPETTPVSGKRTKKPTMKLVESILQARHGDGSVMKSEMSPDKPRKRRSRKMQLSVDESGAIKQESMRDAPLSLEPLVPYSGSSMSTQDSDLHSESSPGETPKRKKQRKSSQLTVESTSPKYSLAEGFLSKPAAALSFRKSSQDSDSSSESKSKRMRENEPYKLEILKLQLTSKIEKEPICSVCEKNGEVVECHGPCGQHFHPSCLRITSPVGDDFKCEECLSGVHPCFSCKVADSSTKKCSVHTCGKFYHSDCVQKLRLIQNQGENKGFICPLHTCQTCAVDNIKNIKASKGRFFRCIRCPTAYHHGDFCIAAGSQILGGGYIVCSDHFQPNKTLSVHAHVNITWCFLCSKGGALLCCDSCPASYHPDCVKVDKTPDEAWFCEECMAGRRPLYGNIVWIKVGNYRWWPGEICHPRHVPQNIQEKTHQIGEFPVRFFGSHDYYWIHKGRVFLFEEGDKASRDQSSKNLYKIYMKGVEEATEAFKQWTAAKEKKEEQEQEKNGKKPSVFKFAKKNFPVGNVQINMADVSEIPRCECKEDQEDPCSSDCLNRMVMYECHPGMCPAKEHCNNQRFQKRQYADCEPFRSEGRGWGLRTLQDLKKGHFVMEYVGDLIDEEECKRRIQLAHENNITNFYMLTMDKNRIIDAGPRGNHSRFMNHSCCPNMETQKWMVNGDIRVGLFSLCDIPKGTELTFNYNLECLGNEKTACSCGAENCSGFLGVRPKTAAAIANEKKLKDMKKKRKKKKIDPRKEHEDDCFRCGEGGELVMCDKGSCPKVYHLQCLKLTKPPTGKWSCPWHHCDTCGKTATSLCAECPNSFCSSHIEGNIVKIGGNLICTDHEDLIHELSKSVNESKSPSGSVEQDVSLKSNKALRRNSHLTNGDLSEENLSDSNGEIEKSEIDAIKNKNVKVARNRKNENDQVPNGKKVAKRKSFKDILREETPSPIPVSGQSGRGSSKRLSNGPNSLLNHSGNKAGKQLKEIPNGDVAMHTNSTLDIQNEFISIPNQEDKIGICLKKTGPLKGGRAGEACRTKARYKAQLLSSQPTTDGTVHSRIDNGMQCHPGAKVTEDNEDTESLSNLVIDIP